MDKTRTFSATWLVLVAVFAVGTAGADTLVEQGYTDLYNLRFDDAHKAFGSYEQGHPDDPIGPVSDAAACLFSEFDRLHILQSEFFADDKNFSGSLKRTPDASTKRRFDDDLQRSGKLAAIGLQKSNGRADAMFANTMRLGLGADYMALIERRNVAALSEMKKGRQLAEQLLAQYPTYFDAYIAVGVENYLLSLKPAPIRWILRASGAQTDKQIGLEKLKLTAAKGHYLLPYARLLLAVAALRDGDKKQAHDLLTWLSAHYPQNDLYRQELAKLR